MHITLSYKDLAVLFVLVKVSPKIIYFWQSLNYSIKNAISIDTIDNSLSYGPFFCRSF